ncbi:hypothetical protein QJ854_gp199 [Moumouvirus goulette]|uniref:Uncharacterized protein n=1 Tax=Moumouvirus goulette TaxID=1247379 RepID=M1PHL9_9VIRU|nr:hypothetical protein QJ854_gp199 [Moumouvirus goulette]AGF85583.1 hypothetical protein glt_00778 [Moumouvirus goulette]
MNNMSFQNFPYPSKCSGISPCAADPLYNPGVRPCPPCPPPIATACPPPRTPCPLKSFCDPGLMNTCNAQPIVNPLGPRRAIATWKVNYLISNRQNQASHTDPDLINPWGIVIHNNQLWIVNNGTDTIGNYDLFGNKLLGSITIRNAAHNSSFPTGMAVNCGGGFNVTNGSLTRPAILMTVSEHGTGHGYNPQIDPLTSFITLNTQITGEVAVYRGLTIVNNILYIADFMNRHIDVFDGSFNRIIGYHFVDNDSSDPIPLNYAPTNIVNIGCYIYILYAEKDPNITIQATTGPGKGFISVFNLDGSFVRRFTSRGVLNDPWAMIPAPCDCGFPPGSFLVSNHGDGRINIFDCNGKYVGPLLAQSGLPVVIDGIRGLAPHYTDFNEIYFTASFEENTEGIAGSLTKDQVIYF